MFAIYNTGARGSLIMIFFRIYLYYIYIFIFLHCCCCLFFFFSLSLSSYYLFKPSNYTITFYIIIKLCLLLLPLQVFLRNQVRRVPSKEFKRHGLPPIHHIKWWISHFRGAYRTHTASEVKLFVILAAFGRCIRELGIVCWESPRSTSAFYWDFWTRTV